MSVSRLGVEGRDDVRENVRNLAAHRKKDDDDDDRDEDQDEGVFDHSLACLRPKPQSRNEFAHLVLITSFPHLMQVATRSFADGVEHLGVKSS